MTMELPLPARLHQSVYILAVALTLGCAGDYLFKPEGPWSLGGSIWVAMLGMAAVYLNRKSDRDWLKTITLWSAVAFCTTMLLVIRDTEVLIPLTLLVQLICVTTVLVQARGTRLIPARINDYLLALKNMPEHMFTGLWNVLDKMPSLIGEHHSRSKGVIRGVVIVAPLMLIFTALFSAADANFERYASSLGDILYLQFPQHIITIALISGLATGLLICTMPDHVRLTTSQPKNHSGLQSLGDEELAVIMGALASLFIVFVVLQASYLFGGREMIENVGGLTLAAYARRGFFELLAVSIITLIVLLWISSAKCNQRIFQPLAIVLVCCVLIILASAAQRLSLYTDSFGLTLSRVMAAVIMLWLTGNLVSFVATVLRGRSAGFASGMFVSAIASIIVFGAINPAAIVARVNIDNALEHNHPVDVDYLTALGADAVPPLLARMHQLPMRQQCFIAHELITQYNDAHAADQDDWRTWNANRSLAKLQVRQRYSELALLAKEKLENPEFKHPLSCSN